MKTLGILGGMSPESTVSYYLTINRAVNRALGGNASAPLLMSSVNFEEVVQCQKSGNWAKAGEMLAEQARLLERIGAQGILIGANTIAQSGGCSAKCGFCAVVTYFRCGGR